MIYKKLNPDLSIKEVSKIEFEADKDYQIYLYGGCSIMLIEDNGKDIGYLLLPYTHVRQAIISKPYLEPVL